MLVFVSYVFMALVDLALAYVFILKDRESPVLLCSICCMLFAIDSWKALDALSKLIS